MDKLLLKLCSLFLQYPDAEWLDPVSVRDAMAVAAESGQSSKLKQFGDYLAANSLITLQETYVQTFDLQEKVTLDMAFYLHDSNQDRNQAVLSMQQACEEAGYAVCGCEQPDFLPAILEYAAIVQEEKSRLMLKTVKPALERLQAELIAMGSPYRDVISTVLDVIDEMR